MTMMGGGPDDMAGHDHSGHDTTGDGHRQHRGPDHDDHSGHQSQDLPRKDTR